MTDPIEQLIGGRILPRPTSNLDRRIKKLTTELPATRTISRKQRSGVLSLVGGTLAVCLIGLVFSPSEKGGSFLYHANRFSEPSQVHSIEVVIPSLNLHSADTTYDRDWLFSPGKIVVSTSIPEGEEK